MFIHIGRLVDDGEANRALARATAAATFSFLNHVADLQHSPADQDGVEFQLTLAQAQREDVLVALSSGKLSFDNGLPARVFWTTLYQTVLEGIYSDPIYGGNRNKAGWAIIGFPGAIAVHRENVEKYRDKKFPNDPVGIADMS